VGPRDGLDAVVKRKKIPSLALSGIESRPSSRALAIPTLSDSDYGQRYAK